MLTMTRHLNNYKENELLTPFGYTHNSYFVGRRIRGCTSHAFNLSRMGAMTGAMNLYLKKQFRLMSAIVLLLPHRIWHTHFIYQECEKFDFFLLAFLSFTLYQKNSTHKSVQTARERDRERTQCNLSACTLPYNA